MNNARRIDRIMQSDPTCEYRESEQLTHIDGFLVCYKDRCRITLSAQLSENEKAAGLKQMLAYMSDPNRLVKGIYVWQRQANQQPVISQVDSLPEPVLPYHPTDLIQLDAQSSNVPNATQLRLELPRAFLHTTLNMIINQPVMRQIVENEKYVLVEEEVASGHHIKLILQQAAREQWAVQVVVVPPLLGQVVVAFGPDEFRASLASNGTALFADLPLELLMAVDGPGMELWII